ncbi:hypothetical protein [Donghicola tyrosinivorans]|uniref:hypothetical protein n=1 Tax=Donghicola tyrosinivorans TaxID=1652492 RepID=UPI0011B1D27A|nr:hypothetical protein [Donghicola tyrosinivorans]
MEDSHANISSTGGVDPELADLHSAAIEKIAKDLPRIVMLVDDGCWNDALRMTRNLRGISSLFRFDDITESLESLFQPLETCDFSVKSKFDLILHQVEERLSLLLRNL